MEQVTLKRADGLELEITDGTSVYCGYELKGPGVWFEWDEISPEIRAKLTGIQGEVERLCREAQALLAV